MRTSRARTLKSPWNHRRSPRWRFNIGSKWKMIFQFSHAFCGFHVTLGQPLCDVYTFGTIKSLARPKNKSPLSDCNPTRIDWGFKRFFSRRMRQVNITCQLTRCGRTMVMWDVSCVLSLSPCFLSWTNMAPPQRWGRWFSFSIVFNMTFLRLLSPESWSWQWFDDSYCLNMFRITFFWHGICLWE